MPILNPIELAAAAYLAALRDSQSLMVGTRRHAAAVKSLPVLREQMIRVAEALSR